MSQGRWNGIQAWSCFRILCVVCIVNTHSLPIYLIIDRIDLSSIDSSPAGLITRKLQVDWEMRGGDYGRVCGRESVYSDSISVYNLSGRWHGPTLVTRKQWQSSLQQNSFFLSRTSKLSIGRLLWCLCEFMLLPLPIDIYSFTDLNQLPVTIILFALPLVVGLCGQKNVTNRAHIQPPWLTVYLYNFNRFILKL